MIDIENFHPTEDKTLLEKRGLDMFSSIMTNELQNEMSQLLIEQQSYKNEIAQLKKERNFLFKLLKKQTKCQKEKIKNKKENDFQTLKKSLSFYHHEQISIPPIRITNLDQLSVNISDTAKDKKYSFSKNIFLDEIKKFDEIALFERLSEIIELSQNGDSMLSYFVNTIGNEFIEINQQNKILHENIGCLKRQRREAVINSIESFVEPKKQDLAFLSQLIGTLDFDEISENDDNDILLNTQQDFDFNGNKEISDLALDDLSLLNLSSNNANSVQKSDCVDGLTDYDIYF